MHAHKRLGLYLCERTTPLLIQTL